MARPALSAAPAPGAASDFAAALAAGADFGAALAAGAAEPGRPKAERTRLRLMASLAAELAGGPDRGTPKVADVTARAGLAHGTFYRYFADIRAAADAVVDAFAEAVRAGLATARAGQPGTRERVRGATLAYVRLFRANPALMRRLIGIAGDGRDPPEAWRALNRDWHRRMAAAIARRRAGASGGPPRPAAEMLPVACALGAMIDGFLTELHLRRDPALARLADDDEAVADLLTDLWCAGADGSRPVR